MTDAVKKARNELTVTAAGQGQFWVENDWRRAGCSDDIYVSFSGFFGKYGPNVFSAAPELLDLIRSARPYVEDRLHGRDGEVLGSVAKLLTGIDAAIAKAEGR